MTPDIWSSAGAPGWWRNFFAFGQQTRCLVAVTGSRKSFDEQSSFLHIPSLSPGGGSFQQGGCFRHS